MFTEDNDKLGERNVLSGKRREMIFLFFYFFIFHLTNFISASTATHLPWRNGPRDLHTHLSDSSYRNKP